MYNHISQNSDSTKHSTPTNMFQINFDYEIFRIIHEKTNVFAADKYMKERLKTKQYMQHSSQICKT